ncbi:MAG TPA: DNA-binding protein [Usitatibacter sp.]|nr:DNA-binding protein [Usitatibacter sp.]
MAERKAYLLRVDPEIWAEIERLAQGELRSVNGQVEYLLREALERRGILPKAGASRTRKKGER